MAYQTVNPATNQLIKEYPSHTDADVEAALKAADALYHSDWAKGDISQRLPVLHKLADLIDERAEDLAKIASQEMGKLIEQSRGEVKLCAQIARDGLLPLRRLRTVDREDFPFTVDVNQERAILIAQPVAALPVRRDAFRIQPAVIAFQYF
jgi:acyl-CoA reductase-like NAD-dependent aldehyde dehydrogenase